MKPVAQRYGRLHEGGGILSASSCAMPHRPVLDAVVAHCKISRPPKPSLDLRKGRRFKPSLKVGSAIPERDHRSLFPDLNSPAVVDAALAREKLHAAAETRPSHRGAVRDSPKRVRFSLVIPPPVHRCRSLFRGKKWNHGTNRCEGT